ncbi:MAG: hypothetical protein JXB88_09290 [Spirochaetales bacterium]|nr:hypothetical protein [Spirochaetales bacterium]
MRKFVNLILISASLVGLASLACVSAPTATTSDIKDHTFQNGLTGWKYYLDDKLENEAEFIYNDEGDLIEIKIYNTGKPFIFSYLTYLDGKNDKDEETRYRVLVKQEYYDIADNKLKWKKNLEVAVIKDIPCIKSLTKKKFDDELIYEDRYQYDEAGRMIVAERTYKDDTVRRNEYTYKDNKKLGLEEVIIYFDRPEIYYNRNAYTDFYTDTAGEIELKEPKGVWIDGSYYYLPME